MKKTFLSNVLFKGRIKLTDSFFFVFLIIFLGLLFGLEIMTASAGVFVPFTTAETYHVTTIVDGTGEGTLRTALSQPNRHIVFDVTGIFTITGTQALMAEDNTWIDGASISPRPTIAGMGLAIRSKTNDNVNPMHNFKINNIRFRSSTPYQDFAAPFYGVHNGLITHCSFSGRTDGDTDTTTGAYDIEFSYNMHLGPESPGPQIVAFGAYHISVHHSLFYNNEKRTPSSGRRPYIYGSAWNPIEDPITDARYNIVWSPDNLYHYGMQSEDSRNNFAYNLFNMGQPIYYYINDDLNINGESLYTSEIYFNGNASIPDCRKDNANWAYVDVNHPGKPANADGLGLPARNWNHSEWAWSGNASGAVWPDKSGIIEEWQDVKNNVGPDPTNDDVDEALARAEIVIPATTIFDLAWNAGSEDPNNVVDDNPPTITNFSIPATADSLTVSPITFTASDDTGITGYCLTETNDSATCSWNLSAPDSFTFSTEGSHTLYAFAKDAAGNISSSSSGGVIIAIEALADLESPTISSGLPIGKLPSDTTSVNLSVITNENATCKYATSTNTYIAMTNTFTTTGETNHTVSIKNLKDDSNYNYFIRCQDLNLNANATDYIVSFSIKNKTSSKDKEENKTKRKITNSKSKLNRGEILIQKGKRFSKNSDVLLYFSKANGDYWSPVKIKTSSTGKFSISYRINKPKGNYNWYAFDTKSGKRSKMKVYSVR
ncbi:MAG: hypothetical protein WC682_01625 [Parcubacteria group bacterium]|jgi:hypothetical protein